MRAPARPYGHRTIARVVCLLAVAWAVLGTAQASAAPVDEGAPKRILFPVVGQVSYEDDFGAPRSQGSHEGNDIIAGWRAPVVAVEAGQVRIHTTSTTAGCMLYLYGRSGATYLYIHLNNDLGPDNDNSGPCKPGVAYAPGLRDGQTVRAGELIGYVGNSGDADAAPYHLHFELHPGGGEAVSPYRWLRRAEKLLFALPEQTEDRSAASAVALTLLGVTVAVAPAEAGEQAPTEPAPTESGTQEAAGPKPGAGAKPGSDPPPPPPPSGRSIAARAAGGTLLTVRVSVVRLAGGGKWRVTKRVTLFVPDGLLVERSSGETLPTAQLAAGDKLTVTTSTSLSLDAQLGRPGVLAVTRILLRG